MTLRSDGPHVLGFFTFTTRCHVEFDGLTFVEGLVPLTFDVGVVNEDVVSFLTRDETVAFFAVEKLHCALHIHTLFHEIEGANVTTSPFTLEAPARRTASGIGDIGQRAADRAETTEPTLG